MSKPENSAATATGRTIAIPDFCLVVLVGATGSGKSTFAAKHFLSSEVISSDWARGRVGDDETDQSVTADAFDLVHHMAGLRLKNRRLAVIDATSVRAEDRAPLVALARRWHALPVAIVLDPGEAVCVARNRDRPDRPSGAHVVRHMYQALRRGQRGLQREGFRVVHRLRGEEAEGVQLVREPLWTDRRELQGPFDIIGDVHGCCDELEALLTQLGYDVSWEREGGQRQACVRHPEGRKAVFVGDLVDRGPRTPDTLRLVHSMVEAGDALCVMGNHDSKLAKALSGRKVKIAHGLEQSLEQLAGLEEEESNRLRDFLDGLRSHYWLDGGRLCVSHAGLKEEMIGRGSAAVRSFAMYGETTGEIDAVGLPVRLDWARDYRGETTVVYGHTPIGEPQWVNNTLCIDTGCVFGGKLTALRWPERELVSVPARSVYVESPRPLAVAEDADAQADPDTLPDMADVMGRRWITPALGSRVRIEAERNAAALETISRFAVAPQWLCYLPPTMSPVETSAQEGWLERPEEAFSHYRERGVVSLVCEEKHMGSRAIVALCRDAAAARRRFGMSAGERTGRIWTRTGRPFFEDHRETESLARLAEVCEKTGIWEELATDWLLLDAEIMPWSAKAQELIRQQYAPVAAAASVGLALAGDALAIAAARGVAVEEEHARIEDRKRRAAAFGAAWRRYCWEADDIADYRIAPFHLLASEGAVHSDRSHAWHMEWAERLAVAGDPLIMKTRWRQLDPTSETDLAATVAWWEELTEAGGEGMVVKPADFVAQTDRGSLAQPALKVRGRDYLRIIYGPDYDRPDNLIRLKRRGLGRKRRLALQEFALGEESLRRFVAGEPLRRWHECVVAVLALESEPVDPRL